MTWRRRRTPNYERSNDLCTHVFNVIIAKKKWDSEFFFIIIWESFFRTKKREEICFQFARDHNICELNLKLKFSYRLKLQTKKRKKTRVIYLFELCYDCSGIVCHIQFHHIDSNPLCTMSIFQFSIKCDLRHVKTNKFFYDYYTIFSCFSVVLKSSF